MKKNLWVLCMALLGSLIFSITALAGDINSGEQSIINAISGTYEYNGAYYKVTDEYIAKITEYFSQDNINISDTEARSYIQQFEMNIDSGISAGYMVKVGDVEDSSSDNNDNNSKNDKNSNNNNDNNINSNNNSDNNNSNNNNDNNSDSNTDTDKSGNPLSGYFDQPESENGVIEDNTIGSTTDGEIEYTVLPIDEESKNILGIDSLIMYVWGIDTLEVHAEAYKDSEVIGTLSKGDAVTIMGMASTGWVQIEYDNIVGYISAVYLRTQGYMISIGEIEVESDAEDTETIDSEAMDSEAIDSEAADDSDTETVAKDYSDAAPVAKSLNLGVVAAVIVIVFAIGVGIVIFLHKNKNKISRNR